MPANAATLAFFLALNESDSPMLLWLVVGGLMALGPVLHSYVKVWDWFKGKSVDTSDFVTKSDFQRVEAALKEIARDLPAIHRALGRLEGHDDQLTTPRRDR